MVDLSDSRLHQLEAVGEARCFVKRPQPRGRSPPERTRSSAFGDDEPKTGVELLLRQQGLMVVVPTAAVEIGT